MADTNQHPTLSTRECLIAIRTIARNEGYGNIEGFATKGLDQMQGFVEQLETTQRILVEERRWRDEALSLVRFLRPDLDATRSRADDLVKRGEALNPAREPINFGGFNAMTDPLSPPVFGASAIPSAASPEGNDGAAGGESSPAISPPETCDLCNGTGKRSERYELYHPLAQDCSKCNGTGVLSPASEPRLRRGSGDARADSSAPPSGSPAPEPASSPCWACNGTGQKGDRFRLYHPDADMTCSRCGGSGREPSSPASSPPLRDSGKYRGGGLVSNQDTERQ